jgi:predicted permease
MLLAAGGAAIGVLIAYWMVDLVVRSIPQTEEIPHWVRIQVDGGVLLYVAGLAIATALLFGLVPALRASRVDLASTFRSASRSVRGRSSRLLEGLVGLEVALALTLLLPATLLVRSFLALGAADPGFETDRLLTARLVLSGDRYDEPAARSAFYQDVADRMAALPGVEAVAWTGAIPADDGGPTVLIPMEGDPDAAGLAATAIPVSAGYFETLGLPMVAGREPSANEVRDPASRSAVVGRRLASRLWPGQPEGEAVGRTLRLEDGTELMVVGVAPDIQYEEFGEDGEAARLQIHVPYGLAGWRTMALMARTRSAPEPATAGIQAALREADPTLPLFEILSMDDRLANTRWGQALMGRLFAVYGAAALLLALAGIYGVMAYGVSLRRWEIGIRIALGADRLTVMREVAGRGLRIALVGTLAGTAGAFLAARALRGSLYGIEETDPATFAGVLLLMITAVIAAAVLPTRAATRMQPLDSLNSR